MWLLKFFSVSIILINSGKIIGYTRFLVTKNYYHRYNIRKHYRRREFEINAVLMDNITYFKYLSPKAKNKFIARLWKVYKTTEFVGYQGLEVTEEMKICVLASKIQLTFGLKLFHFRRFTKVILYPESFYSRFFERDLKGLTSGSGFITLSWADFKEGYLIHNDKFNLGLHEMAHALRLELEMRDNYFSLIDKQNEKFDSKAMHEMKLMERGAPEILREYALTNKEEFFAVCVEYFFEAPLILKDLKPELFNVLSAMLNQDPLNTAHDYSVKNRAVKKGLVGGQRAKEV